MNHKHRYDFKIPEFVQKMRHTQEHKQIKTNSSSTNFSFLLISAECQFKLLIKKGISKSLFYHFRPHLLSVMKSDPEDVAE